MTKPVGGAQFTIEQLEAAKDAGFGILSGRMVTINNEVHSLKKVVSEALENPELYKGVVDLQEKVDQTIAEESFLTRCIETLYSWLFGSSSKLIENKFNTREELKPDMSDLEKLHAKRKFWVNKFLKRFDDQMVDKVRDGLAIGEFNLKNFRNFIFAEGFNVAKIKERLDAVTFVLNKNIYSEGFSKQLDVYIKSIDPRSSNKSINEKLLEEFICSDVRFPEQDLLISPPKQFQSEELLFNIVAAKLKKEGCVFDKADKQESSQVALISFIKDITNNYSINMGKEESFKEIIKERGLLSRAQSQELADIRVKKEQIGKVSKVLVPLKQAWKRKEEFSGDVQRSLKSFWDEIEKVSNGTFNRSPAKLKKPS